MSKFHAKDGWHFARLADGSVQISHRITNVETIMTTIDPSTWASVISSVTAGSETSGSFAAAEALHAGKFGHPTRELIDTFLGANS